VARTALLNLVLTKLASSVQLDTAAAIMRRRFNAAGVPADVVLQADGLTVHVAPADLERARELASATGVLRIRQVLQEGAGSGGASHPARIGPRLQTLEQAMAAFATFTCGGTRPADESAAYLVACDANAGTKYLLAPAAIDGTEIKAADAGLPQNSIGGDDWQVDLAFKAIGTSQFAALTARVVRLPMPPDPCAPPQGCNGVAIVLDGVVMSAPFINPQDSPNGILGGQATISGNFTQQKAENLAAVLKYGALPVQFDVESAVG
jgi:preprotein translocase subunit SecD